MEMNPPNTACTAHVAGQGKRPHAQSSHPNLSPYTIAFTGCPPEYSAKERYNNNSEPLALLAVPPFRTDVIFPSKVQIQNRELQFCFTWPIRFAQSVNKEIVSLKVY